MALEIYRSGNTKEELEELVQLLINNDIPFQLEEANENIGQIEVSYPTGFRYAIKIKSTDKDQVDDLVKQHFVIVLDDIPKDFYMFDFTDEELMEVIIYEKEWAKEDVKIAGLILKNRGLDPNNIEREKVMAVKLQSESEKEPSPTIWLIVGYLSALMGGVIGLAVGIIMWRSKRTLSDGSRIFDFVDSDRKHGRIITILGVIMMVLWTVFWQRGF